MTRWPRLSLIHRLARLLSGDLQVQLNIERDLTYARDMGRAHALLGNNRVTDAKLVLDRYLPGNYQGSTRYDRREFAWFYLQNQIQRREYHGFRIMHKGRIGGLAFSPDGRSLVSTSSKGEVFVWDTRERRLMVRLEFGGEDPSGTSRTFNRGFPEFSSDGGFLVVRDGPIGYRDPQYASGFEGRVWRQVDGRFHPMKSFSYDAFQVGSRMNASSAVRFVPKTHLLAIGRRLSADESEELCVILYDVEQEENVGLLSNAGTILDVSPDGKRLLTRRWLGAVPELVLWDLEARVPLLEKEMSIGAEYANFLDNEWVIVSD